MTSLELLESLGAVKGKYVLEAHGEEMPGNNIISFDSKLKSESSTADVDKGHIRRRAPMKKSVLIAAIVAAMLMLAGFAYAVMKLQELSLGEYTYTQPNSQNPTEKVIVTNEFISMQGLKDSPEFKATREWQDFRHSYDTDGKILGEIGNGPTGLEDMSLHYQVYTQEMYDKLVEISDKYGLELHSEMNLVSQEELDYRVGGCFIGDSISRGWAYIYENGTFQFDCDTVIDEKKVLLQLRRSVKGTLDEPVLNIGSVEEYQEVQYETACGESVLLELGVDHSLIYADFEECFILLNVLAGREMGVLTETTITIDDLKRMADEIDFSILKNVIKPDMRGDSITGTSQDFTEDPVEANIGAENEMEQEVEAITDELYSGIEADRLAAYQTVLQDVYNNQKFPGGRELGYDGFPMSDNRFALEDIDQDGSVELILLYTTTYVGGHAVIIYDYDATTGSVREQFVEYPGVTCFDNGILKADASHNHSLSEKIWPYTLYQYDAESDGYEAIAMVEAWDKSLRDTDYEGNAFPDDVDKDGDLTVYYIMDADNYELKDPVDLEEYEKWFESYRGDAEVIRPSYMELTEENISKLK